MCICVIWSFTLCPPPFFFCSWVCTVVPCFSRQREHTKRSRKYDRKDFFLGCAGCCATCSCSFLLYLSSCSTDWPWKLFCALLMMLGCSTNAPFQVVQSQNPHIIYTARQNPMFQNSSINFLASQVFFVQKSCHFPSLGLPVPFCNCTAVQQVSNIRFLSVKYNSKSNYSKPEYFIRI